MDFIHTCLSAKLNPTCKCSEVRQRMESQSAHFSRHTCRWFTFACIFHGTTASLSHFPPVKWSKSSAMQYPFGPSLRNLDGAHTLAKSTPAALHCACKKLPLFSRILRGQCLRMRCELASWRESNGVWSFIWQWVYSWRTGLYTINLMQHGLYLNQCFQIDKISTYCITDHVKTAISFTCTCT